MKPSGPFRQACEVRIDPGFFAVLPGSVVYTYMLKRFLNGNLGKASWTDQGGPVAANLHYKFVGRVRARLQRFAILTLLGACLVHAQGIITTIAGNGGVVASGDGGLATNAALGFPDGVAVDGFFNVYIADSLTDRVRKVLSSNGTILTVAGGGAPGVIGDGGSANSASLVFPGNSHIGLAIGPDGNLYIADYGNNRIRKVNQTTGIITTVAGAGSLGQSGFSGDGGPATAAMLNSPSGIAFDKDGNLYIADTGNGRIRKVDASGVITTVAGKGNGFVLGDGGNALNAQLANPSDVAVDSQRNIYIADVGNHAIRKVNPGGVITSILHGSFGYCSPTSVPAPSADIGDAAGLAVDSTGNLYIADHFAGCIQELETNGSVSTVAGGGSNFRAEGVAATTAALGNIWAVAVDSRGNFYLTDNSNYLVKKVTARTISPSSLPIVTSVINGAGFQAGAAPNTWVTIKGSNLSPVVDSWDSHIIDTYLPTVVDGVSVTIGGKAAYVQYISASQINIVTPPDMPIGLVQVVVTTPAGPSAPFTVVATANSPAFFKWPNDQPVATHTDFSWAVKAGTFSGTTTISAKSGEVIILWANGFGPTKTAPLPGILVPASPVPFSTTSLPSISVQLIPAIVYDAALAPGFAALFQVAFQVPLGLADGDYPITGSVGGTPFLSGQVLLSVHH
jgi:uncharacterized protein (TIGR03437 family)